MVRQLFKGLMKRKSFKRGLIVLIIGIVVAGLFAGGVVPLAIAPPDFSTNTVSHGEFWGISARGWWVDKTELLDSNRYITGEASEKVVMEGQVMKTNIWAASCISDHRFRVYYTKTNSWGEPDWYLGSGMVPVQGLSWTATGASELTQWSEDSGWLKVELWLHIYDFCGISDIDKGWNLVATDMADVRWGGAELEFNQSQYEVGELAKITYTIAFARSAKLDEPGSSVGWTFTLFSGAQDSIVHQEIIEGPNPDGSDGNVVQSSIWYTVQPADFVSGGCAAGANNFLEAKLYNNLVFTEEVKSTTVDERDLAPPEPIITVDKTTYYVGDFLTVQATAIPNPTTQIPICSINLHMFYDDGSVTLFKGDLSGDAVEKTYGNLPSPGLVKIEAYTWDENGRTSAIAHSSITVLDPTSEPEGIDIFWIVVIMVILAVLSIIIWIPMIPLPPAAKLWISIIAWGVILGLVIFFFIVPIVVEFFGNLFPFLQGN